MSRPSRYHQDDVSMLDEFYVIAVISNPVRFESRYDLYEGFKERMARDGVNLFTVELQQGERSFQVTEEGNPMHLQLRTRTWLWHKENMVNLALQRLPKNANYIAWIDADVEFTDRQWAMNTIHALQTYDIVQLFSHAIDLGPNKEFLQKHNGFMWSYQIGKTWGRGKGYDHFHPGYAWAARRSALEQVGGLIDKSILGAGDHHMACALIGKAAESFPKVDSSYAQYVMRWQERAERYIQRNVGYVPGTINHFWHGKKKDRQYVDRWMILINSAYNTENDLYRDIQGLYQLNDNNRQLRDGIRKYMSQRSEDSIDLE